MRRVTDDNEKRIEQRVWPLVNMLRRTGINPEKNMAAYTYLIYLCYELNKSHKVIDRMMPLHALVDEVITDPRIKYQMLAELPSDFMDGRAMELVAEMASADLGTLEACLLHMPDVYREYGTPASIIDLALRILDIQPGEAVEDLCSGVGDFITTAYASQPAASYFGNDSDKTALAISLIRSKVKQERMAGKGDITLEWYDVFQRTMMPKEGVAKVHQAFDKIFANYPWIKHLTHQATENLLRLEGSKAPFTASLLQLEPRITRQSMDWVFNGLVIDHLKEGGKAVAIMPSNSLQTTLIACCQVRAEFMKQHLLEAVIALPPRLLSYTNVNAAMVVFSHGNDRVRLIDTRNMYSKGRRQNYFSAEDLDQIMQAYQDDGENSKSMSIYDLIPSSIIYPPRYLTSHIEVKDGKAFKSVIKSFSQGTVLGAANLDELKSDVPTPYQYLQMKDIDNGQIAEDLTYLKDVDTVKRPAYVKDGMLLMSRLSSPVRFAIANVKEEQHIIANGNLYLIELNQDRVDPYYILALFYSDLGADLLDSICQDGTMQRFLKKDLCDLVIPVPSMETQKKIAAKYLALQDEIALHQRKIAEAMEAQKYILDAEREG